MFREGRRRISNAARSWHPSYCLQPSTARSWPHSSPLSVRSILIHTQFLIFRVDRNLFALNKRLLSKVMLRANPRVQERILKLIHICRCRQTKGLDRFKIQNLRYQSGKASCTINREFVARMISTDFLAIKFRLLTHMKFWEILFDTCNMFGTALELKHLNLTKVLQNQNSGPKQNTKVSFWLLNNVFSTNCSFVNVG